MTLVSLEDFRANVDAYVAATANGDVILTRDGKPCAMLCATPTELPEGDSEFGRSPEFWKMIRERRQEATISWHEALEQLDL